MTLEDDLFDAIQAGDANVVRTLLTYAIPPDITNVKNYTALYWALASYTSAKSSPTKAREIIAELAKQPTFDSTVNTPKLILSSTPEYPLEEAVRYSDLELVKLLIAHGADKTLPAFSLSLSPNVLDKSIANFAHIYATGSEKAIVGQALNKADGDAVDLYLNPAPSVVTTPQPVVSAIPKGRQPVVSAIPKALVGKYTNTDVRPEVFGLNATPSNVIKYGSLTAGTPVPTTDLKEIIDNDAYRLGLEGGSQTIVDPVSGDMYSAPSLQELGSAMIASSLHNLSNWRRSYHDYDATFTYEINDQTLGSDNKPYQSLQDNNIGHDPVTSPAWWGAIKAESVGLLSSGLSKLDVPLTITADLTANTISVSAIDDIYFVKDGDITKISVPAKVFTVNQANLPAPTHPDCIAYRHLCYDKTGAFVVTVDTETDTRDLVQLCGFIVQFNASVPTFLPASKVANPISIRPYLALTPWTQKSNRNQVSEISVGIVGGGLALQLFDSTLHCEGANLAIKDPANVSVLGIPAQNPLQFRYVDLRMVTSVNGFSDLVTAVDPTKYYNGTDVVAVPAGKFTIQPVLMTPRGEIEIIYTEALFDDIDIAATGANQIVLPTISETGSIFLGVLVLAHDCTDLGDISKSKFIKTFGGSGGSSGGSGGGTTPANNGAVYIPVYERFHSTEDGSNIYGFGGITQLSINSSSVVNIITFQSNIAIPPVTDSSTHFAQFPPVPLASATPIQLWAVAAYIDSSGVNTTQSTKAIQVEYNMNTGIISLPTGRRLSDYRGYVIYVNGAFSTAIPGTTP